MNHSSNTIVSGCEMLCADHWIDITWDHKKSRLQNENLLVQVHKTTKQVRDFDLVCDQVAKQIHSQYPNLVVAMSGGLDSEYVAECFYRNHIPFTPLILRYNQYSLDGTSTVPLAPGANPAPQTPHYEIWYAQHWCRTRGIQPVIVDMIDYVTSDHEKNVYLTLRPRLLGGAVTAGFIAQWLEHNQGHLVTGHQLEYYPDWEQMNYLSDQLGGYRGFVMQESDMYIETLLPEQHPWAFFYWNAEVMASLVHSWDVNATMCDNKARIYGLPPRPKFMYPNIFPGQQYTVRKLLAAQKWGSIDVAKLGDQDQLLSRLTQTC